MGKLNDPVSAGEGMLLIGALGIAGLVVGCIPSNGAAVAVIALLFVAQSLYIRNVPEHRTSDISLVLLLGLFACLATALAVTGARLFLTTPGVPLMAFWVYLLISSGYMVSRCCLGWHVGASAAVLTAFVAIGLLMQSLMAGGMAWLVLTIFAAGLWWGADSWRRANGLAVYE